ncbi:MAG: YebC/PmpR family DNA-binding transcriptional regulator [Mycoplasma sp.]
MAGHSQFANIKHKKEARDKKRAVLFQKFSKEISILARINPNLNQNPNLRMVVEKARANNMPKDNIERALTRHQDSKTSYETIYYEGYGKGGTNFIVKTLTDNKNRTAANIRSYFSKKEGKLATPGSVTFQFINGAFFVISKEDLPEDTLLVLSEKLKIEELIEEEEMYIIITNEQNFNFNNEIFKKNNITDFIEIGIGWYPKERIKLSDLSEVKNNTQLIELLENDEDVQEIYHNIELND